MTTHVQTQNPANAPQTAPHKRAWVVFSGKADLPWLRILRPGFRHCYVILHDGHDWLSLDPLSHCMEVTRVPVPAAFDLPRWLRGRGLLVVPAPLRRIPRQAPCMPFTCVEAVKRVLGIHSRRILTPWQLYRHLSAPQQSAEPHGFFHGAAPGASPLLPL